MVLDRCDIGVVGLLGCGKTDDRRLVTDGLDVDGARALLYPFIPYLDLGKSCLGARSTDEAGELPGVSMNVALESD